MKFFKSLVKAIVRLDARTKKMAAIVIVSFCVLIGMTVFNGCGVNGNSQEILEPKETSEMFKAEIVSIIDGDTVELSFTDERPEGMNDHERVRLCGVDTPEMHYHMDEDPDFYAQEATDFTRRSLSGRFVMFMLDSVSDSRDRYGRAIGYVLADGENFNRKLISEGYARYYGHYNFESKMMTDFLLAEKEARANKKGMWSDSPW